MTERQRTRSSSNGNGRKTFVPRGATSNGVTDAEVLASQPQTTAAPNPSPFAAAAPAMPPNFPPPTAPPAAMSGLPSFPDAPPAMPGPAGAFPAPPALPEPPSFQSPPAFEQPPAAPTAPPAMPPAASFEPPPAFQAPEPDMFDVAEDDPELAELGLDLGGLGVPAPPTNLAGPGPATPFEEEPEIDLGLPVFPDLGAPSAPAPSVPAVDDIGIAVPPPPPGFDPAALQADGGVALPPAPPGFDPAVDFSDSPAVPAPPAALTRPAPPVPGPAPVTPVPAAETLPEPEPEVDDQLAADEPPHPPQMAVYRGELDKEPVHSICSLQLRPDYDEICPALAAFDKLEDGEIGFVRVSIRPASPGTRDLVQHQLTALNTGEPLEEPSGWDKLKSSWGRFLVESVSYVVQAAVNHRKAVAPTAPWAKPEPSKPMARATMPEDHVKAIDFAKEKVSAGRYFESRVHIGTIGGKERAEELDAIAQDVMREFNASYSNGATGQGYAYVKADPYEAALGLMPIERSDSSIVSPPELGEMFHIPDQQTKSATYDVEFGMRAQWPMYPYIIDDPLEPPAGMLAFGEIYVDSNKQKVVGMPIDGLKTHMYLCGSTGTGKSTLLEWFCYGLAKNRKSIFLVDPHGTLVDNVLNNLLAFAPELTDDILVLDFGDAENPISFNPIAIDSATEIEGTVNSVKEMILKILNLNPDSAPRAVNYVEQAVWALCEANIHALGSHKHLALSLLQVPTFFTDPEFRQLVMQFVTNMAIRETYDPNGPFEQLGPRQQLDHVMPVLRTFATLATKDSFGNIFGQSENKIDFAKFVRERKMVMMKLPAIGAGNATVATFIGAMVTPMLIGSLSKWKDDKDLSAFLIIDEFQNYATESFKELLAQTRKYGLHAIAANQVPQDLPADVLRGVQSNTQSKFVNRLDAQASKLIGDFIASGASYPTTKDIVALPNYWTICNHMIGGGRASGAYVFRGLPPALDMPDDHPLFAHRMKEGRENLEKLLPVVMNNSRLASSVPRDLAWERRQNHMKDARQVLEHKIHERMRQGGYEGGAKSASEEAMDDYWDKN